MSTEDFEIKEVVKENKQYNARMMDTFRRLETYPNQWQACEIIGENGSGFIFDIPANYTMIEPYYDLLKEQTGSFNIEDQESYNCQLCGHPIKNLFPIKHNSKRIYMNVGSECINNFTEAGYITKKIKVYKETEIRKKFDDWIDSAIDFCSNQFETGSAYFIKRDFYDFRKKLYKAKREIKQYSTRKINNLLKAGEKLKIPLDKNEIKEKANNLTIDQRADLAKTRRILKEFYDLGYGFMSHHSLKYIHYLKKNDEILTAVNKSEKDLLISHGAEYSDNFECWIIDTSKQLKSLDDLFWS